MKLDWLKHAFAVDPPGPAEPTEAQKVPVDWLAHQIAKRHLTTPSLIAIEMCRPLNWLFAQSMHVADPAIWAIATRAFHNDFQQLTSFMEQRGSMDYIARRIEELEEQFTERQRLISEKHATPGAIIESESKDGDEED